MKIRSKIILLISGTFVSMLLLFALVVYYLSDNFVFNDFYDRLSSRTLATYEIEVKSHEEGRKIQDFKERYLEDLPLEDHRILKIVNGKIKGRSSHYPTSFIKELLQNKEAKYRKGKLFYYGKLFYGEEDIAIITTAQNSYYASYSQNLATLLIVTLVISVLLIIIASAWLSKRFLRPIEVITQNIDTISSENLHIRIEPTKEQDELGDLIEKLNGMFDRLETSFESQNNFISNASHELNTPLTSIIAESDLTLSRDRSPEEYKMALENILLEAEKLDKKTKALLFLAQTGFNGKTISMETIRVDELIFEAISTVHRLIPGAQVHFETDNLPDQLERLRMKGNPQLITLALTNVILNGCKYSGNQLVTIKLNFKKTSIEIIIKDTGIGIPEAELPFIYDPFFRASNTRAFEGYGIGLPLSRNVIRLHKGKMTVHSVENKGVTVIYELPVI